MNVSTRRSLLGLVLAAPFYAVAAQAQGTTPAPTPAPDPAQPPAPNETGDAGDAGDAASATAVTLTSRPTLVLSGSAEWDDGLRAITGALDKIRDEMGKANLTPGGRPLAVFTETDDKGFRYEAMVPLSGAAPANLNLGQGVRVGESPAGKTMKFEHRGAYDDIDSTYEAITAYLDEKGLAAQNLFIEEYLTPPKSADDEDAAIDIYVFLK